MFEKISVNHLQERVGFVIYLVFSILLAAMARAGFSLSPSIYLHASTAWHARSFLTDVFTCGLPLFNWALAFASLANFSLFIFTCFKPLALGQSTFYFVSLATVLVICGYAINLLMAYFLTSMLLTPSS